MSDLSTPGIARTVEVAEATASHARFPAPKAELPSSDAATTGDIETVDARLWNEPFETLESYAHQLLSQFDGRGTVVPSFGSIKATLSQSTISNSQGLERGLDRTTVEFEFAVKASGGPEGAPPGEYLGRTASRLAPDGRDRLRGRPLVSAGRGDPKGGDPCLGASEGHLPSARTGRRAPRRSWASDSRGPPG